MQEFIIAQRPVQPDQQAIWHVEINRKLHREYSSRWVAIVDAFLAAYDATRDGEEATVVMEASARQIWTFSPMRGMASQDFDGIPPTAAGAESAAPPAN